MQINKDTSFIKTYFDDKEGEKLRSTITPNWDDATLKRHLGIINVPANAKSVLEIGCGIARLLKEIYDNGGVHCCTGLDASEAMINEGRVFVKDRNIDLFQCDGTGEIGLIKSNFFDFSFSFITFQHIPNTETVKKYISEMIRVTKPGGEVMFQVLAEDLDKEYLDKGYLWSYHSLEELMIYLAELGIINASLDKCGNWGIIRCKV